MTKRPSLFGAKPTPAAEPGQQDSAERTEAVITKAEAAGGAPAGRDPVAAARYPKASTREGKRVVTAYLDPEAFRQLKRIAADEDAQQQDLLIEGINAVFEKRGLSRIA
ncbi:ribbon-helix-helix domain-containing protein [Methylobacterium sp. J-068]|uniref:ribbon-helix-helix domain-containing protein n=1 Tax=Methylobacterium sp. J-068 TaxID=2836649 RepID=UPI001FBA264F|nr:ribbon-helix-helix domain-containing protein [Methylobacterium sp. J-068]MCJ2036420.1 hypothetical protein [Methylobacterium sp. J-068]